MRPSCQRNRNEISASTSMSTECGRPLWSATITTCSSSGAKTRRGSTWNCSHWRGQSSSASTTASLPWYVRAPGNSGGWEITRSGLLAAISQSTSAHWYARSVSIVCSISAGGMSGSIAAFQCSPNPSCLMTSRAASWRSSEAATCQPASP